MLLVRYGFTSLGPLFQNCSSWASQCLFMQSLGDPQLWDTGKGRLAWKYCACNDEHKWVEGQTINRSIVNLLLGSWVFALGFFGGLFPVPAPFALQEVWWCHFPTAVVGDSHTCLYQLAILVTTVWLFHQLCGRCGLRFDSFELYDFVIVSLFFTSLLRSPRLPPFNAKMLC